MSKEPQKSLLLEPIGYAVTGKDLKFQTPHQPGQDVAETNLIRLLPGKQFELALQDLEGFEKIWLVWWFDRNQTWRPRVMPPRGPGLRRGVFATRSPHRPNPIGLTAVSLLRIEGLELTVGPLDLLDGTPILDIKPYIPAIDAFPGVGAGWVDELATYEQDKFDIEIWDAAQGKWEWLCNQRPEVVEKVESVLRIDPSPNRTRRIILGKRCGLRLACGPWRIYFSVQGSKVRIDDIGCAFALDALNPADPANGPLINFLVSFKA